MARTFFVAVAAFAESVFVGAEIAVKPVYPAHQEAEVPLADFNVLLEFSESVQKAGSGNSISLRLLSGASAGTVAGIPCGPNVHLSGRYAVVTFSGVILEPGQYSGTIDPSCFSGASTGRTVSARSWTFRTISRGSTVHSLDVTSPRLFTELVPPPSKGWAEPSREVDLFFSEAVQPAGGDAVFRFVPADLASGAVVPAAEGHDVPVIFDPYSLGKVSLSLGELPVGLEYRLAFAAGVLRDSAGNLLADSKSLFGADGYAVRISNQVESFFPADGAADISQTSQVVIHFASPIAPGIGSAELCIGKLQNPCSNSLIIAQEDMLYVGSDLILALPSDLEVGQTYTLSLPSGVVQNFAGMEFNAELSAYTNGAALYSFTVSSTKAAAPEVPAGRVDVARRLQTATAVLSGQTDVEPSCVIKLDFTSEPIIGETSAVTIRVSGAESVYQTIGLNDLDRVVIQGTVMLIAPQPSLEGGRSYEVSLPAAAVQDLSSEFTFSFSTRPADTVKPTALFFWPPGSKERGKNVVDDNPPYIQFSEAIAAVSGKKITFQSGKHIQYTLDAADSVCGTGGSIEDGCVVINDLDNRVHLYPRGQRADSSGLPEPWASPGVGYKITVEQGAFKDALTAGAVGNFNDVIEFSDRVSSDDRGPVVVSGDPGSVSEGFALAATSSEVFLTFDEIIYGGDSKISIKVDTYGGTLPPQLVDTGSETVGPKGQVVLTFDQAVQAGNGVLEVYRFGVQTPVFEVNAQDAYYADNKVILAADLLDQGSYYAATSSPDAILSRSGVAMESALNTESSLTFDLSSDSEGPQLVWSTADGYNCFPADGFLPDFMLVMNQAVDQVDDSKTAQLYDEAGQLLWSRPLTDVSLVINSDDAFEATLLTSSLDATLAGGDDAPLNQGGRYRLRLEAGALVRDAVNGEVGLSPALDMTFGVCEVRFTTPASKLLRIYSPYSFSKSSETLDSATSGARLFSATMASTSLLDGLGNHLAQETSYDFGHDLSPPALDPQSCNPPAGSYGSPYENIVMAFTEVVQAGSGALQLWSRDDTGELGLAFQVDVSSLVAAGVHGHTVISDNMVSITPKTLCNPDYGSCTDLPDGVYSVRTVDSEGELAAGVFLDVLGNPLSAVDSESGNEWTFTIQRSDSRVPEVVFDAGSVLMPASGYYPAELRAYVYFTERVQLNPASPYSSAVFIDCGADHNCDTTADNSESLAVLTFGTGSTTTGLDGYGMLRVSRYGMPDNRRYQVVVPTELVVDYSAVGSTRAGPSSNYTFTIEVGTVATLAEETVRPHVVAKEPKNAARRVAVNAPLVLYFDEDVERGAGIVKLCTNSDAQATLGNCNVALLSDSSAAEVDIASATVDRRVVTLSFSSDYVHGSTLYVFIPEGIIVDSAGNTNTEIATSMYTFNVVDIDDDAPTIDYTYFPTSPSEDIVLHFSEAVTENAAVSLGRSGLVDVPVSTMVSGNTVTISADLLDSETYILTVPANSFSDFAGNAVVEQGFSFTVTTTPGAAVDPSDVTGPLIGGTTPADGDRSVPPSTSFQIDFNEVVQAGEGSITLESNLGSVEVLLARCYFDDARMVCDPDADLTQFTTYSVSFPAGLVQDVSGNPSTETVGGASGTSLSFTTIDLDLTPPYLTGTDPANGAQGVSPGRVLTLSFSETVQANAGSFLVLDCSPGDPDLCYDGVGETVADTLVREISVDGSTAGTELLFEGNKIYIAQPVLAYDKRYSVQTSAAGVVVDSVGLPLTHMISGFEFTSERADTTPPEAYLYVPEDGGSAITAPNSDIIIMFSEPVQATGSGQSVSISAGGQTIEFGPEDPAAYFNVSGFMLTMRPPTSLPYDSGVSLSMPPGMIADYAGNEFGGIWGLELLQWQTASADFEEVASSASFAARQGATVQVVQDQFLLFGGRSGSSCFNDVFVSADGASWSEVTPTSSELLPSVDQAAAAADAAGCMWLLGGQCDSVGTSQLWRTCTVGQSWETFASPSSLIEGVSWPDSLSGHAIAILGGWQLLVLDAVRGDFWAFTDSSMATVARTATELPFGGRWGPKMFTTSGNDIFVVGGQACSDSGECAAGGEALMDVWKSPGDSYTMFVGSEWYCETADFRVGLEAEDLASVGARYPGMVLVGDDTLYLVAGQLADQATSTTAVFSLAPSAPDAVFNAEPNLASYGNGVLTLYFDEGIDLVDATKVSLLHLGADSAQGGTGSDGDTYMDYTASASRQRLVLTAASNEAYLDGLQTYQVLIEDGALADSFGNLISGFPAAYTSDLFIWDRAPELLSVLPAGEGVAPWTHVALAMSEDVVAGSGSIQLTCAAGQSFSLPVADAVIAGASALFKLPSGAQLTPGQLYTINVPNGLFRDTAGNKLPANAENTFTVLSGVISSSSDGYSGSAYPAVDSSSFSASADVEGFPSLESVVPPVGATDVPTEDVAVIFTFSEQVVLDTSIPPPIIVELYDAADAVVATYTDAEVTSGDISIIENGLKVAMPTLTASTTYTVRLFVGQLVDLAGNAAPAAEATFTCLAGLLDTTPPQLAMTSPPAEKTIQDIDEVSYWFLEDIQEGTGDIEITLPSGLQRVVIMPSSSASVQGPRLTVELLAGPEGLTTAAGTFRVELPAGVVTDLDRTTQGGGIASGAHQFTFGASSPQDVPDILQVTVAGQLPSSSTMPPASAALMLTFDEVVQAGEGSFHLTPQGSGGAGEAVVIPAKGTQAVFQGDQVWLAPGSDLVPGQEYMLTFDATAVKDLHGASAAVPVDGENGWDPYFLIRPTVAMERVGSTQFGAGGGRHSVGVAVNSDNEIFVVGGADDSDAVFGDVWRLKTYRETNCASALMSLPTCSLSLCSGSPATLGTWGVESPAPETVWRSPSLGGRRCIGSDGVSRSDVGDVVNTLQGTCRCPLCYTTPLSPLPSFMEDAVYLEDYIGAPASASTAPLNCNEGYAASPPSGYESSEFECLAANWLSGAWRRPYPECTPHGCELAPPEIAHQDMSIGQPCSSAAPWDPLPHLTVCPMQCKAGYATAAGRGNGNFTCTFGEYDPLPTCEPQLCSELPIVRNGTVTCDVPAGSPIVYGTMCNVVCDPGFHHNGAYTFKCDVQSSLPEASPTYTDVGVCQMATCGELAVTDYDPRGVVRNYTSSELGIGSKANVWCEDGYRPSDDSFSKFDCQVKSKQAGEGVSWVGRLKCVKITCDLGTQQNGYFVCQGRGQYEDSCQLVCIDGYALAGGDGSFDCGADGQLQGQGYCAPIQCPEPALPDNTASTTCSGAMENGTNCSITCNSGYQVHGIWQCVEGTYVETPACIESGVDPVAQEFIVSALTFEANLPAGRNISSVLADASFEDALLDAIADSVVQVQLIELDILEKSDMTGGSSAESAEAEALDAGRRLQASDGDDATIHVSFRLRAENNTEALSLLEDEVSVKARFESSLEANYAGFNVSYVLLDQATSVTVWQSPVTESFITTVFEADSDPATVILGAFFGVLLGLAIVIACALRYHTRPEVINMFKNAAMCPRMPKDCCKKRGDTPLLGEASSNAAENGEGVPASTAPPAGASVPGVGTGRFGEGPAPLAGPPPGAGVGVDVGDDRA